MKEVEPGMEKYLALSISLKAINDKASTKGLFQKLLVLGAIPLLSIQPQELLDHAKRVQQMTKARKEISK